jgi:hypothetical protein
MMFTILGGANVSDYFISMSDIPNRYDNIIGLKSRKGVIYKVHLMPTGD